MEQLKDGNTEVTLNSSEPMMLTNKSFNSIWVRQTFKKMENKKTLIIYQPASNHKFYMFEYKDFLWELTELILEVKRRKNV